MLQPSLSDDAHAASSVASMAVIIMRDKVAVAQAQGACLETRKDVIKTDKDSLGAFLSPSRLALTGRRFAYGPWEFES